MAEREVTIKLGSKASNDIDAPLKRVGAAAQKAAKDQAALNEALKKTRSELDEYVKKTNAAAAADRAFAKDKAALAAAIDRERAAKEKSAALDKARGGGGGGMFAGTSALRLAGVAGGTAAAGLGIAGKVQDLATSGGPMGGGFFRQGQFSAEATKESFLWQAGDLPLVGRLVKLTDAYIRLEQQVKNVNEAEASLARTEERIAITAPFAARDRGLRGEAAGIAARLQFGSSSMGAQFGIGVSGQAAVERAQLATSVLGAAGMPPGTALETRKAEIAARGHFQSRLAQQAVEHERALSILGARERQAGRVVTGDPNAGTGAGVQGAQRQLDVARQQLQSARNARAQLGMRLGTGVVNDDSLLGTAAQGLESLVGTSSDIKKSEGQANASQKRVADLAIEKEIKSVQEAERQLQEALDAQRALSVERGATLLEQQRERLGLMQQERDRLTGIIEQERSRKAAGEVSLGLQSPLMRKQLVHLARSIASGRTLSERELQFASAHGGEMFRPAVEEIARKRGGAESDEIRKLLNIPEREKMAQEARVALDQKITVEIKANEGAIADQLGKVVFPQIETAFRHMMDAMRVAFEKFAVDQRLKNAPGFGGGA